MRQDIIELIEIFCLRALFCLGAISSLLQGTEPEYFEPWHQYYLLRLHEEMRATLKKILTAILFATICLVADLYHHSAGMTCLFVFWFIRARVLHVHWNSDQIQKDAILKRARDSRLAS